jgi:two-component system response regulator FlrC
MLLASGEFREDLYHRLAVFPITLPPLRERRQDIVPLSHTLLAQVARDIGRHALTLAEDAERAIAEAPWPGNVRQLANALERAAILADGSIVRAEHLALGGATSRFNAAAGLPGAGLPGAAGARPSLSTLEEMERAAIEEALAQVGGNRREAAERLGIGVRTLYEKLKKYRGEEDQ